MSNDYTWWRAALAGNIGAVRESEPQPGYYRMRRGKGGPWIAVAIWEDEGGATCVLTHDGVTAHDVDDFTSVWTWCCRNPISYETYTSVTENGEAWPDDISEPPIRPNADPLTQIQETIEALASEAARDLDSVDLVADKAARDRAANYATRLTELAKEADDARDREKRPHLEAGREIDARWRPVIDRGKAEARRLKDVIGDALKAIKAKAAEQGVEVVTKSGTRGKSVALRTRKETRCTDWAALWAHYRDDERLHKDPGFCKAVMTLAELDMNAGRTVPGAAIELVETAA